MQTMLCALFATNYPSLSFDGQLPNIGYKNASDIIQQGIHPKKQLDSNHQCKKFTWLLLLVSFHYHTCNCFFMNMFTWKSTPLNPNFFHSQLMQVVLGGQLYSYGKVLNSWPSLQHWKLGIWNTSTPQLFPSSFWQTFTCKQGNSYWQKNIMPLEL